MKTLKALNKIKAVDFYKNFYTECMYKGYKIIYCQNQLTITKNNRVALINCIGNFTHFKNRVISYITLVMEN